MLVEDFWALLSSSIKHPLWCFVAFFFCQYTLFCRDLHAFAKRKIMPKIMPVEKKGQISGTSTTGCQRGDQQCTQYKSWNWGLVRKACKTLEDKSQTSKCLRQLICLLCSWQLSSQLAKLRRKRNAEKRRKSSSHCCDPTINLDILVFPPTLLLCRFG